MTEVKPQPNNEGADFIAAERRRLDAQRQRDKTLFVRNILNSIFILLAIVAMIGVLIAKPGTMLLYIFYGIGILAILIKIGEVMIRMPSMLRKPIYQQRRERK